MTTEQFYEECASLLGVEHHGVAFPHYRRNRWNNRTPGRGRFEGCGLIRAFGDVIHIHLHHPKPISGVFEGFDAALEHLRREIG